MLVSPRISALTTLLTTTVTSTTLHPKSPTTSALREKILAKSTYLPPSSRSLSDNSYSDYYAKSSTFSNAFGFNPTQFSLSYSRCAQVQQFDDSLAAQEDSTNVFTTKHFAIFRFCPSKSCDPYAVSGEKEVQYDEYGQPIEEEEEELYMNMNFSTYQSYRSDKYKQYEYGDTETDRAADDEFLESQSQFEVGGASGSGCSSNYGEYMIELEGKCLLFLFVLFCVVLLYCVLF